MLKPTSLPSGWPPLPPINSEHYRHAIPPCDERVNFLLCSGSLSSPPLVYLVTPDTIYACLSEISQAFLNQSIIIDIKGRLIKLPKICEVYGEDFGKDHLTTLKHCLRYLDKSKWEEASLLVADDAHPPTIKFRSFKFESHERLQLCGI